MGAPQVDPRCKRCGCVSEGHDALADAADVLLRILADIPADADVVTIERETLNLLAAARERLRGGA